MALEFHFGLVLLSVYGTSYLFKFLGNDDIPILLAEIIAGIVFGSVFGVVDESIAGWEFFTTLAAFGLLVITFEAGLELDPEPVLKRPKTVRRDRPGSSGSEPTPTGCRDGGFCPAPVECPS